MWMMTVENYEDMFDIDGTCGITTPSPREVLQRLGFEVIFYIYIQYTIYRLQFDLRLF